MLVRAIIHKTTDKALLVQTGPPKTARKVWLPRSQVSVTVLQTFDTRGGGSMDVADIQVPGWLADKHNFIPSVNA